MSLADRTAPGQTEAIAFEVELPHAPAKVWRALTEPGLLARWLLPVVESELALAAGAPFTLRTEPQPGWDGTVSCRVLEVEAERRLSYAWVVAAMGLDTVVTFTLTPTAAGTRLAILQSGFTPAQRRNFAGARYGWRLMGGRLLDLLAAAP